jgi:hypothetical protein
MSEEPASEVVYVVNIDNFTALGEAWIDLPFDGVVPHGWGESLQSLVNAVSAIVDPDRTLREDPEVKRRGSLAGYRQRHGYAVEMVKIAGEQGMADALAHWTAKRDDEAARCLAEHGVTL